MEQICKCGWISTTQEKECSQQGHLLGSGSLYVMDNPNTSGSLGSHFQVSQGEWQVWNTGSGTCCWAQPSGMACLASLPSSCMEGEGEGQAPSLLRASPRSYLVTLASTLRIRAWSLLATKRRQIRLLFRVALCPPEIEKKQRMDTGVPVSPKHLQEKGCQGANLPQHLPAGECDGG